MKTLKRNLPVNLTQDERHVKALEMAAALSEYDDAESEKKEATRELTAKMKELRARATALREEVSTGKADRLVDCIEEANLIGRIWEVFRTDTGERVETRPMTNDEIEKNSQLDIDSLTRPPRADPPRADGDDKRH